MNQRSMQRTQRITVQPKTSNLSADCDDEYDGYDDVWPARLPTSTRRYQSDIKAEAGRAQADVQSLAQEDSFVPRRRSTIPPRRRATRTTGPTTGPTAPTVPIARRQSEGGHSHTEDMVTPHTNELEIPDSGQRTHWLVYAGLAMVIMMVGWVVLTGVMNWWQIMQDDWHYGRPRTFQMDMVVGHNDSATNPSHFIALNLNRHVEIVEFPGGDASKARIYMGPVLLGQGQDLAPVTLDFKDMNRDGKLDMIVNVQGSHFIFVNQNGTFQPPSQFQSPPG